MIAYGYLRVSTEEQARTGYGLAAQHAALTAEADRRGWPCEFVTDEGVSASVAPDRRRHLGALLPRLRKGDVLMVAKLDRIARSQLHFALLTAEALRTGWSLIALDLGVDMTTPTGRMVAQIMMAVAEWERQRIAERTSEGLQAAKAQGKRLGRPRLLPDACVARVCELRATGLSHNLIAAHMNADGIPTALGRRWTRATVAAALRSAALDAFALEAAG